MSTDAPTLSPVADAPPAAAPNLPRPRFSRPIRPRGKKKTAPNPLRRLFWVGFLGLLVMVGVRSPGQAPESLAGALFIIIAAMLPAYLWVSGKVRGLPLWPACALSSTWTYALPLVSEHPIVMLFPGWNQLVAALSVTGYLLIGTLTWFLVARRKPRPPAACLMMNEALSQPLLLIAMALCAGWTIANTAGWVPLSSGTDSLARAISTAVEAMACFVLGFGLGQGRLSNGSKVTFFILLAALVIATLPSLLLIVAMCLLAVTLMGYVVASNRLPWGLSLAVLCVFGFLHVGKASMREKYWHEEESPTVTPLQYPGFFLEWAQTSLQEIRHRDVDDDGSGSLLERASLMHWMLYFQAMTPGGGIPYLNGETYAVIPHLFVPRIFDPDKPRSHEATYIISIHYGLQTREDTETTNIAFGLLSEAYVNFGFTGMGGLAVVLGLFYGQVAYWARGMPILSFRGLFAVLIASYSFQAEFISTYYAAALFQSTVVLAMLAVVFMRVRPLSSARVSVLE